MRSKKSKVKSNAGITDTDESAIIGTYEGEALDSNITNKNGLDITVEVMEAVLESEDYKDGIEHGWFIGFLGHPEDPGCQEFKDGCIVMTDMWINDDNKVHAKFNLLNTPVGRIVKTYIDAGVTFGISIRGAGDIIDNSVDPDTFCFRGFDLVAFPAYPESIPTFSEIAASTDIADRKKYESICAVVKKNLGQISSSSTIDILKSQFAKQSDVYKALEQREKSLGKVSANITFNMDKQKLESVIHLYLESVEANRRMSNEVDRLRRENSEIRSNFRRKIDSMERITASQIRSMESEIDAVSRESQSEIMAARRDAQSKVSDANKSLSSLRASCDDLRKTNSRLKQQVDELKNSNLIYRQRIEASESTLSSKDSTISELRSKLRETVSATTKAESRTSNLDAENEGLRRESESLKREHDSLKREHESLKRESDSLRREVESCRKMLHEYQDAYATMYAASLGIDPSGISVSDDTSVSEIRNAISSATNTSNIGVRPAFTGDYEDDEDYDFDMYASDEFGGMITM